MIISVIFQVQVMDDSILQPDETSQFSSIVRLQPHIKLAIAVTIVMPCRWIDRVSSSDISPNLRLLALMPEKDNDTSENSHWTWEDVTDMCPLSIFEDCCHFQTSFLTTYVLFSHFFKNANEYSYDFEFLYQFLFVFNLRRKPAVFHHLYFLS